LSALKTCHFEHTSWLKSSQCAPPALSGTNSNMSGFILFQEILGLEAHDDSTTDLESANQCLQYLKSFLDQNDNNKRYGELQRLRVDDLLIWSVQGRENEIKSLGLSELERYAKEKQVIASKRLQESLEKNTVEKKGQEDSAHCIFPNPGSPTSSVKSDITTQLFPSTNVTPSKDSSMKKSQSLPLPIEFDGGENSTMNSEGFKQEPNLGVLSFPNESFHSETSDRDPFIRTGFSDSSNGMVVKEAFFDDESFVTASTVSTEMHLTKQPDAMTPKTRPGLHNRIARHVDALPPPEVGRAGLAPTRSSYQLSVNRKDKDMRRKPRFTPRTRIVE